MKARARETIAERAAKAEFNKHTQEYANHVAHSNIALFLYLLEKWGCKLPTIIKRYSDIKAKFELSEILGRKIHDEDYIKYCKDKYGIDVTEIKVHISIEYV